MSREVAARTSPSARVLALGVVLATLLVACGSPDGGRDGGTDGGTAAASSATAAITDDVVPTAAVSTTAVATTAVSTTAVSTTAVSTTAVSTTAATTTVAATLTTLGDLLSEDEVAEVEAALDDLDTLLAEIDADLADLPDP